MIKDKDSDQIEELSKSLDSLNDGTYPITEDKELKELIDMADFIKQSYNREELPQMLIDKVVDNLANEFQAEKKKRHLHWLYKGFMGTAVAAAVIAAFVQFLVPQSAEHYNAQNMEQGMKEQKIAIANDQSNQLVVQGQKNEEIPLQAQLEDGKKEPMLAPTKEKVPTPVSEVLTEIVNIIEPPKTEEQQNQVAILREEMPKDIKMRKSAPMSQLSIHLLEEQENISPKVNMATMMVLPNQTAQSTTIDVENGVIKQVYTMADHDEITITQRLDDGREVKNRILPSLAKDAINSLTVKVDGYLVTVEGKKTRAELQKIAASLVEKEIK